MIKLNSYNQSLIYSYLTIILLSIFQISIVPIILKITSENDYASFLVFQNIVIGFTNFIGWLSASSVKRLADYFYKKNIHSFNELYSLLKIFFIIYLVLSSIVYLILHVIFFDSFLDISKPILVSITVFIYISIIITTAPENSVMVSISKLELLNKFKFYSSILFCILSVSLLYLQQSISAIYISYSISGIITFLLIKKFMKSNFYGLMKINKYWGFKKKELKRTFFEIGLKASIYSIFRYFIFIDIICLTILLDSEEVIKFSFYWLPANFVMLLLFKFSENIQPQLIEKFSKSDYSGLSIIINRIFARILIIGVSCAFLYFLIFPFFASWWVDLNIVDYYALFFFSIFLLLIALARFGLSILYSNANYSGLIKISLVELIGKFLLILVLFKVTGFYVSIFAHILILVIFVLPYTYVICKKEIHEIKN